MEDDKVENLNSSLGNIPMDITYDASEKTMNNSDSIERVLKSEENQSVLRKDLCLYTDNNFITWENRGSNICWLDASMAILVHNQTMRQVLKFNPNCQVSQITKCYDDAIATLNNFVSGKDTEERLCAAREKLQKVQESSLRYLQPLIKCKKGEPDSAFCSILNLIKEDKLIQSFFNVTYAWVKQCENCEMQRVASYTKPIITITYVDKFVPENHSSPFVCQSCNFKNQKMKLVYRKFPACLIYHFENGAGDGTENPSLSFLIESREYQLTGVMLLEKSHESNVNHFVTYIRYPSVNKWLECNDLNMDITSFSTKLPTFNLKDVYIYVYETFDNLGTIDTKEDSLMNNSNQNIPCIDISDELDAVVQSKTEVKTNASDSEENIKNVKAFLSNPFNQDFNASFSKDKICAQVHVDSSRNAPKNCLDSKIKNSNENNTGNEVLHPFSVKKTNEENVCMKGNTETKLSDKCLLNRASENVVVINTSKVAALNTSFSEDKVCAEIYENSSRNVSKNCLDSKIKNSILSCDSSEFTFHEKNTENEILQPFGEKRVKRGNVDMKEIALTNKSPKRSQKINMEGNDCDTSSEEEMIKYPKKRKNTLDDSDSSSTENEIEELESINHSGSSASCSLRHNCKSSSIHKDMSCDHPKGTCMVGVSKSEAVSVITDNIFFICLDVFGFTSENV